MILYFIVTLSVRIMHMYRVAQIYDPHDIPIPM